MEELDRTEIETVGGALNAYDAAGLILGFGAFATSPIVIGLALGAAGGLVVAGVLADL